MGMAITEVLRLQAIERLGAELERQLANLDARIQGLEARSAERPALPLPRRVSAAALEAVNGSRKSACDQLRAAIGSVLAAHPHPESITAKDVAQGLARAGFEPMPRDRTLRLRLAEVRAEVATRGNTASCQKSA